MAVLVIADVVNGQFKKAALETVSFGKKLAEGIEGECVALCLGEVQNAAELGVYGADRIIHIDNAVLNSFDSQLYTDVIEKVIKEQSPKVIVLSHSSNGKSLLGRLSVRLKAGAVSGVNAIPEWDGDSMIVRKSVFSGKAIAKYAIETEIKIISLMGNAVGVTRNGHPVQAETISMEVKQGEIEVTALKVTTGKTPLPEAEMVVSAGRGMKDPSNWGIIEELAEALGATTACSRPVSDSGWRPHHEHVGQTGIAIRPNLYIAVGISGAIQHLAGVNNSKVIVVINKDPEAPFFKAADYGVCADLFEVVPRLTEAVKKFKAES